jgi:hypothetical protein
MSRANGVNSLTQVWNARSNPFLRGLGPENLNSSTRLFSIAGKTCFKQRLRT